MGATVSKNLQGLDFGPEQLDALVEHARAASPEECCGVLLGRSDPRRSRVLEVVPARNAAPAAERRRRFHIDPAWLATIQQRARRLGLEILGYYHSHPEGGACPSEHDAVCAVTEVCTVIIGLGGCDGGGDGEGDGEGDGGAEIRSWRWSAHRGRFEEETLGP